MEEPFSREGHLRGGAKYEANVSIFVWVNFKDEILLKGKNITPTSMLKGIYVFLLSFGLVEYVCKFVDFVCLHNHTWLGYTSVCVLEKVESSFHTRCMKMTMKEGEHSCVLMHMPIHEIWKVDKVVSQRS